ncbi:hypothetical protein FRC07_001226 [Ceratobasidium sp. 392]|nr:hypothetical protein FRC07_001226 [Ceratobasidium sp. 392]
MPRNASTVLGLPVPDTPVDIDAPRASRTLKRATDTDGSEDTLNLHSAPPRKIKKITLTAAQEGGSTSISPAAPPGSGQSLESTPSLEVPLKTQKLKKATTQVNNENPAYPAPHPAEPTAPAKPSKKKKAKNVVLTGDADGDVEMSAPVPEAATEPGSIVIGDSLVPPSPPKSKKSRKKKAAAATTPDTEAVPPVDESNTAVGPGIGGGKGTGRTKVASALAQKVLEQETQKQLEKEAKAQRKKEKAQRAMITESTEATAAFVAASNASNSTPSTGNNIQIGVPEVSVTTSSLQRIRQNGANKLIAQRVAQRIISPAPSSSTLGSETLDPVSSSHAPSTSHSRGTSRISSVSLPPSRTVSLAPSNHSTVAATSLEMSRAASSQPPTCLPSPTSPALLTLADHLYGVDAEFAPQLPAYNPLPGPLRPPARLKPVPYKDVSKLSLAERREYNKEIKFGVKDLTLDDQNIVSSVISRLEALVLTIDCFPSEADTRHLILVANAWGCRKHNLGNLEVEVGGPYEELLLNRVPQMRTGIIDYMTSKVIEVYRIQTMELTPEIVEYNKDTVKYWLNDGNFTCPANDFGALYEHPIFADSFKNAFFQKQNSVGVNHRDLFSTIPIGTVALAAASLEKSLAEYETGHRVKQNFSRSLYHAKWVGHVATLCAIIKSPHGDRLKKHLRELGQKLLAAFPQVSDSMNTVVVPKVPCIMARYGRSIAAPPPPQPPARALPPTQPLSSAPTPQSEQPRVTKKKTKPKIRAPAATTLAPAVITAPPAPKVPVADNSDTESESEVNTQSNSNKDALADADDRNAWALSIQAETTRTAPYDALHAMLGGESSGDEESPVLAHAPPESETDTDTEEESNGEGVSGAGELTVMQGSKKGGSGDNSDTETSSSDED